MAADGVDAAIERCAKVVPEQLTTMFSTCASDSHRLSEFVLEHVLVHEAAAQQLQVGTAVSTCVLLYTRCHLADTQDTGFLLQWQPGAVQCHMYMLVGCCYVLAGRRSRVVECSARPNAAP
jgi:hypothetical protein